MAPQLRERINKWDYMKLKIFCTTKEMATKLKRPPTEWEKAFAIYTSDKGLIIRKYRALKKLNSPKINDPVKKWANELNRSFYKGRSPNGKKKNHIKKGSTSLAIKEMQIKIMLRFYLAPVRMAAIKNTNNNKFW
jgi:hypothetical protein